MDRYIRQKNLALLSKCLPEIQDEAQRKVILKLLAEEEAKGAADPPKGMNHRGVEYSIARDEPGFWKWCFQIGETVTTGRTQTNLAGMATHKARQRVDRKLRKSPDPRGNRHIASDQRGVGNKP
jgi:hypothetical protein